MKSKLVAYGLWLFGGLFGLHHVYLGRDKQAFIWFSTFGCFFVGYLRDFLRLSDYIDEANKDEMYMTRLQRRMSHLKTPGFQFTHFFGSILIAYIYGVIMKPTSNTSPHGLTDLLAQLLWPLGCAIGAYLVNTEGCRQCRFRWALMGAYCPLVFTNSILMSAVLSTLFINWNIEWKRPAADAKKRTLGKRVFILVVCVSIYVPISVSYVLNNSHITINGEEMKFRDAIKNFLNSKAWRDLNEFFLRLWNIYRTHGYTRFKDEFVNLMDVNGVSHAYEVVGLPESASEAEINDKCKKLSRQWHPDKYKTENEKKEAQEKFMNIQEACNKISSKKRAKLNKNKQFDESQAKKSEF